MATMPSSDPHAWLRPIYARLAQHPAYRLFAPSHQFEQLVAAAAADSAAKAANMRDWSPAAQHDLLLRLASMVEQKSDAREVELWRVRKNDRELRCVAHYLPSGIDVRLLEGDDFRRTQLTRDAPETEKLANTWRQALGERGWTT
jgi:hypothetical protein